MCLEEFYANVTASHLRKLAPEVVHLQLRRYDRSASAMTQSLTS